MVSIYDNINTAEELIKLLQTQGMSNNQDDINRMQDIIGHSTVGELKDLANDIGRNDENGQPDPNGTWSSGRKGTRGTFYSLIFHIWNWSDGVNFWNTHSNPEHEMMCNLMENKKSLEAEIRRLTEENEYLKEQCITHKESADNAYEEAAHAAKALREARNEIIHLKAKLYDLMIQEETRAEDGRKEATA